MGCGNQAKIAAIEPCALAAEDRFQVGSGGQNQPQIAEDQPQESIRRQGEFGARADQLGDRYQRHRQDSPIQEDPTAGLEPQFPRLRIARIEPGFWEMARTGWPDRRQRQQRLCHLPRRAMLQKILEADRPGVSVHKRPCQAVACAVDHFGGHPGQPQQERGREGNEQGLAVRPCQKQSEGFRQAVEKPALLPREVAIALRYRVR